MPSQEEGFPRVILETMAMGVPFVASDVGAVKEIIPKEMLEYVVTSSETKEFAEKLNKILSMTDRELSTLSNIEKDYVKQYDIGIITKSFIKLFE
jgi:glycosyltransferase involved in cell wall biosynthesis